MNLKTAAVLFFVILSAALVANLIALKIASVQVQDQLATSNNSLLKLFR